QLTWPHDWGPAWYVNALFLQNFWIGIKGTWNPLALTILWSLAVEEQFYLTLPWLIRFLNRETLVRVALEGIALAVCARILIVKAFSSSTFLWYVLMPCRADALLLGFLVALLWRDARWKEWLSGQRTALRVVLVVLALGVPFFSWGHDNPVGAPLAT